MMRGITKPGADGMAGGQTANRDELLERWRELESAHASVRDALESALQREHQLSLSEYEVLRDLARLEGQCRMQELAGEIRLSQSALSRLVQRLEDAGLVTRAICSHDRRGINAVLTDAGREAAKRAEPTHIAALEATLGGGGAGVTP
jgi:DNA-binding MarR family transcriptional regulator